MIITIKFRMIEEFGCWSFLWCYSDDEYERLVLVRVNYRLYFRGSEFVLRFEGDKREMNVKLIRDEL